MQGNTVPYFDIAAPYHIAYRRDRAKTPVGPHTHNAAEIYLTHTDLPDVLIDDTVSKAPAGSLIIIPPFCVHQLYHEADKIYERYILSIHYEWLAQILFGSPDAFRYLKTGERPLILSPKKETLTQITRRFQDALRTESGGSTDAISRLLAVLHVIDNLVEMHLPVRELPPRAISGSQRHVNELISYINAHLHENLRLSDLAAHFYLNADYLSRLFKEHTHTSVGHYIAIQKITKAQRLLQEGLSITQVQELLGYSSYAYFAKTFRKFTGMPPGQYRNQWAEPRPPVSY